MDDYNNNNNINNDFLSREEIIKRHRIESLKNILNDVGVLDPYGEKPNPFTKKPYSTEFKSIALTGNTKASLEKDNLTFNDAFRKFNEGDPEYSKGWSSYITYKFRMNFFKMLLDNQVILVIAGTGTGKTVVIPKLLLHYFGYKKKCLMTIPTKQSVEKSAGWSAKTLDVNLGEHIGYTVGGSNKSQKWTYLTYCTQAIVSNIISGDPNLTDYYGIMIDEAHVRQLDTDMLLAQVCDIAIRRPEFKIIIMSASMDKKPFETYFKRNNLSYVLYEPEGEQSQFNVEDVWNSNKLTPTDILTNNNIEETAIWKKLDELLMIDETKSILVFVATNANTKNFAELIQKKASKYPKKPWSFALTGGTPGGEGSDKDEYALGVAIPKGYERKVIIATNAVEFSVTFAGGLGYVIDSGLQNFVYYDSKKNANVQEINFVAQSNIKQRCGRTGRKMSGQCIRMYSKEQYDNFRNFALDEILLKDITDSMLSLLMLPTINNLVDAYKFMRNMVTSPSKEALLNAMRNLYENNFVYGIDSDFKPTKLGILASKFSRYNVKRFNMIVGGYYFGCLKEMIYLTAILEAMGTSSFKNIFITGRTPEERTKINKAIKKWYNSYGEFIALLKIYITTRDPKFYKLDKNGNNINKKNRDSLMEYFGFDPYKIREIDNVYKDILDTITKNNLYYFITQLNLFDVKEADKKVYNIPLQGGRTQKRSFSRTGLKNIRKTNKKEKIGGRIDANKKIGMEKQKNIRKRAKQILDSISIKLSDKPIKITRFKNQINNILAAIFFGYHTNTAHYIGTDAKSKQYLVKHITKSANNEIAKLDDSRNIFVNMNARPSIVIYDNMTVSNNVGKFNHLCMIPRIVIKKFGIIIDS